MSQSAKNSNDQLTREQRVVESIKTAHALLTEHEQQLKTANEKLSAEAADAQAARPVVEEIVSKLSTQRVDGEFLIPPTKTAVFLDAMATKEGLAQIALQMADIMLGSSSASKDAADLGGPASSAESNRTNQSAPTGFASVPSSLRM